MHKNGVGAAAAGLAGKLWKTLVSPAIRPFSGLPTATPYPAWALQRKRDVARARCLPMDRERALER